MFVVFFPQFAGLYFFLILLVGICLLLSEAGLEASAGLMVGAPCAYPLVDGAGCCSFGTQYQKRSVFRDSSGLRKVLGSLPVDDWGCVPTLLVAGPETSQHWSL